MSVRAANYILKVPNVFNSCLRVFEMRDFSRIAFRYFVRLTSGKQHVFVSLSFSLSVSVSVSLSMSVSLIFPDIDNLPRSQ